MMLIRAILACFRGSEPRRCQCRRRRDDTKHAPAPATAQPGPVWSLDGVDAFVTIAGGKPAPAAPPPVPEAIKKQYQKVVVGDVTISQQGVCVTQDVAVLGNVRITAGGVCITGNVLVFGDVYIDGYDGATVNGTCVTGSAIVLGKVIGRGGICVTQDAFVKGDIQVVGSLKVDGKLCHWGQKDVQPLPPGPPPPPTAAAGGAANPSAAP